MNLEISYVTKYINVVCIRNVSTQLIYTLANLPNVVMIELQPHIYPHLDTSVRAIKARDSLVYSPNTAWELGYTGKNIVVAVLDTGVDDEHEFLSGKFVAGFDCSGTVSRVTNSDDKDGHGTPRCKHNHGHWRSSRKIRGSCSRRQACRCKNFK